MNRICSYLDKHAVLRCTECGETLEMCSCAYEDSVEERLHSPAGTVINMIRGELASYDGDDLHRLAKLTAAVGLLAQEMIQHDLNQGAATQEVLRAAVRVATEAILIATESDGNFQYAFPVVEEELPRGPVGGQYD